MPNGHGPPPELNVQDPASLGYYLGWMGGLVYDTYNGLDKFKGEVRENLDELNDFKDAVEERDGKALAVIEAKAEARAAWRRRIADAGVALSAAKWVIAAAIVGATAGSGLSIALYQFFIG